MIVSQRLLGQPFPAFRPIDSLDCLRGAIKVTALNSEIESGTFVLNEMEGNIKSIVSAGIPDQKKQAQERVTTGKPFW